MRPTPQEDAGRKQGATVAERAISLLAEKIRIAYSVDCEELNYRKCWCPDRTCWPCRVRSFLKEVE